MAEQISKYNQVVEGLDAAGDAFTVVGALSQKLENGRKGVETRTYMYVAELSSGEQRKESWTNLAEEMDRLGFSTNPVPTGTTFMYREPITKVSIELKLFKNFGIAKGQFEDKASS